MAKFHVNPAGEPGQCLARKRCPFGDLSSEHFPTARETSKYYEKISNPIHKLDLSRLDADTLIAFRKMANEFDAPKEMSSDAVWDLVERAENDEDTAYAGKGKQSLYSIKDFEALSYIAQSKIEYYGTGSDREILGDKDNDYARNDLQRCMKLRDTLASEARKLKEKE